MPFEIIFHVPQATPRRLRLAANGGRIEDLCLCGVAECTESEGLLTCALEVECSDDTPVSLGCVWDFPGWSEQAFVFLPAGAYAGNRFVSLKLPYSPRVPEGLVAGTATVPCITDVPRLNVGGGPSRLQLLSGDLAFPMMGWFDPFARRAWVAYADQPTLAADWLWEVEESEDRSTATFRVSSPGVRATPVYRMPFLETPSPDVGWIPQAGDQRGLRVRTESFPCGKMADFFDRIFSIRARLVSAEVPPVLPFSAACDLVEAHYNSECWSESAGLYWTDCDAGSRYPFQTGWCGGGIATLPLLVSGNPESRQRALHNLETLFSQAPRPGGLFFGRCDRDRRWRSDFSHDEARPHTHSWTLVRRQADALFYLLRQVDWLERNTPDFRCPPEWDRALRQAADAFVRIWRANRQFGQFVHQETGEILVGGSCSGALVPAALIAAQARYGNPEYGMVAAEAGEYFAVQFLERGFTSGGPGDACQNPDSESVAALIESYAALHLATESQSWAERGVQAAALLATWVMPYDFPFPPGTEFARLGVRTRGSIFANTQNKHSAPGICTHSGKGLLDLFRATGDLRLMDLLCEIARFLPQVVSRPDRPIYAKNGQALPAGWMNERVNTSDWDDNVGGIFYGSCWCEVSLLLTRSELPGIYCRPDLGRVWALDHVSAHLRGGILHVENPTPFPAEVSVWIDRSGRDTERCVLRLAPAGRKSLPVDGGDENFEADHLSPNSSQK